MKVFDKLYRIVSGIWLGSIVFFSGVIAPQIFKNLPKADAANLQNHLFPFYYIVGSVAGFLLVGLQFPAKKKKLWWIALATTLAVVGFTVLTPLIRDAYLTQSDSMKWLHPLAVGLNVVMMICVLVAI